MTINPCAIVHFIIIIIIEAARIRQKSIQSDDREKDQTKEGTEISI